MPERWLAVAPSAILVLGLAFGGFQARAQDQEQPPSGAPQAGGMRRGGMMNPEILTRALNLTDDQKSQVKTILEDRAQKMRSVRSDTSLSPEDRRSKMGSIFEETNSKIRTLLNDEQKQKFDQMQGHNPNQDPNPGANPPQEHKHARRRHHRHHRHHRRLRKILEDTASCPEVNSPAAFLNRTSLFRLRGLCYRSDIDSS